MAGLKQLEHSTGVKVMGGSGCSASKYGGGPGCGLALNKYGGKKCGSQHGGKKGKRSTKKARKSKKSKKSGKRKTAKKSFLARLFKL